MKRCYIWFLVLMTSALSFAARAEEAVQERRALLKTYQYVYGFDLDACIFPIIFYCYSPKREPHAAIEMITAPYTPPAAVWGGNVSPLNANYASLAKFNISCQKEDDKLVVTLDARNTDTRRFDAQAGNKSCESEIFSAILECLRRVMGAEIERATLRAHFKEQGQEKLKILFEKFLQHPKDKEFPHGWGVGEEQ